jgi:hypothetical protein
VCTVAPDSGVVYHRVVSAEVIEDLVAGDLTLTAGWKDGEPRTLRVDWTGRANHRHPAEELSPYFDRLLEAAAEAAARIEFHFERLDHFNSSTILVVLSFAESARGRKIPVRCVYDGSLRWQKMTFEALKQLEKADGTFELATADPAAVA